MPNDDLRNIIAVNHRDDKLVADCLECIVAFPVAVQRMRAASDLATIPSLMRDNTQLSFDALRASNQDCTGLKDGEYRDFEGFRRMLR